MRVLSCIQPTGQIHFGNYFGAVQNWVRLQAEYECFYGIVNYHAMTMPFTAKNLSENSWDLAFSLMALGLKPETLFIQSLVPEHAELSWIFNCFCSYGELSRMTQFKDKSEQVKGDDSEAFISSGLFTYPVLQAADILIYKADFVPVGKDQEQHLELTRHIAARFNHLTGSEYFKLPAALLTETPKIVSPADPTKKMSKSLGDKHYINVFAEEAVLRKQIKSAVTDSGVAGKGNVGDAVAGEMSVGVENLFTLLKAANATDDYATLMADYERGELKYGHLKEKTADALAGMVNEFRTRKQAILANRKEAKAQIQVMQFCLKISMP